MEYIVRPRLGEILKKRNMTQNELAELANLNQPTISRFDRSKLHQDSHLVAISRALGVSIEELFRIEEVDLYDIGTSLEKEDALSITEFYDKERGADSKLNDITMDSDDSYTKSNKSKSKEVIIGQFSDIELDD